MWIRVVYDTFVCVYGWSLVLFFVDAMQPRRSVNRSAVALLFIAFSLETLFLLIRLYALGYMPVYSPFDATLLVSWLVLLVALCINAFFRLDILLFFVNMVGFTLIAADTFGHQTQQSGVYNQADLLVIHITTALISYAAFCLNLIFSVMYLVQNHVLKTKQWSPLFLRLPPLERLDAYAYRSALVGFPLLTVAIVLGSVWEQFTRGYISWLDVKFLTTVVVWVLYGTYLTVRAKSGWGSEVLARLAVVCFLVVLANFWLAGQLSGFHRGL